MQPIRATDYHDFTRVSDGAYFAWGVLDARLPTVTPVATVYISCRGKPGP